MKRNGLTLMAILLMVFPLFFQTQTLAAQDLPDDLQIGKHTVAEWKHIIDTTWGDGMLTEDKLLLFDRFWEAVDKHYPGFVNNPVNWDSVKNHYRPEIEAGVSRGRFAGIITKMGSLLREGHSYAYDRGVYLTKPGPDIPILIAGYYSNQDSTLILHNGWFGATLTPIIDEELLVLRSVEDHPMGLEAGDIILGYDGLPWTDLYPLLLQMDFPLTTNSRTTKESIPKYFDYLGSSEKSAKHKWLASAGMNWHLFDTLDFRKYRSYDILHLPTSLLEGKELHIAGNEQLPVEGIEFPGTEIISDTLPAFIPSVSFDAILDNTIGYIYFFHMSFDDCVKKLEAASQSLAEGDVQGIILDLRYNTGGFNGWEKGFNPIFNRGIDSCGLYARTINGGHDDLYRKESFLKALSKDFLNKPIALITGPGAMSMGDYASYFIHTQPMTRSFGKGTNTAYTLNLGRVNNIDKWSSGSIHWDFGFPAFEIEFAGSNFGRIIDGELKQFMHTGFDIDEEIWFTQEAAYHQKDNLVKRAVDWIKSVAYADGPEVSNPYLEPGIATGSVVLKTDVVNPESHAYDLEVSVYDKDGSFIEDIHMEDNGEERFGTFTPEPERYYYALFSTHDLDEESWLTYPGKVRFASISKPEIFPEVLRFKAGETSRFDVSLRNTAGVPLTNMQLYFSCDNSCLDIKKPWLNYARLLDIDMTDQERQIIIIDESLEDSSEIWVNVDIYSGGEKYWTDSILMINIIGGQEDFAFEPELKIYPNPMEDFCRIQISGPIPLEKLELYDLSGRLVFSENKIDANSFELPKGNLESGIYILKVYADKPYESKLVIR